MDCRHSLWASLALPFFSVFYKISSITKQKCSRFPRRKQNLKRGWLRFFDNDFLIFIFLVVSVKTWTNLITRKVSKFLSNLKQILVLLGKCYILPFSALKIYETLSISLVCSNHSHKSFFLDHAIIFCCCCFVFTLKVGLTQNLIKLVYQKKKLNLEVWHAL